MKRNLRPWVREVISWVEIFGAAFVIAFVVNHCVIANAEVLSGSMEGTMYKGDRIVASRLAYLIGDVERGDIVIFDCPYEEELDANADDYIKRVIGLPGDKVEIKDAKIYINDAEEPLDEPYLKEEWVVKNNGLVYYVPENCYFMLGDNRNCSADSRWWAEKAYENGLAGSIQAAESYRYVPKKMIKAKADYKYWPLSEMSVLE